MSVEAAGSPQSVSMAALSVVVLGAGDERRRNLARILAGTQAQVRLQGPFPDFEDLGSWVDEDCDVLIVDVEGNTEHGLDIVEAACARNGRATVMVYGRPDSDLVLRSMRAGAREFLSDPLSPGAMVEALVRASIRRDELGRRRKVAGKVFLFASAKGGSGCTTLAANFAVLLARESHQKVALLDLDLELGDAALTLGLSSDFSTADALKNERRLDSDLVSTMLVEHSSGLRVLAAPDRPEAVQPASASVVKLAGILQSDFAYVVIDAGSVFPAHVQSLMEIAEKIYLVTQVSVVELRNCHRIIATHFSGEMRPKLEVVLNRHVLRAGEIDEPSIAKALTIAPAWKVPSDFAAARRAQNTATALAVKDGPITRVLTDMARAAAGTGVPETKKRRFGLF